MNKETDMTMKLNPYFKDTLETSNVVWSHDENSYQFNFDFTDYLCKKPVELMNSHPRILLEFLNDDCSDKQIYPLIIDSERLGQAHFIIPDKILGYVGDVKASLTIDFDDKSHDLGSFYFRMKKSPIDDKMPELQFWVDEFDQAFELFKHGLDEFNEDIKESNAKVDEIKDLIVKNDVYKKTDGEVLEAKMTALDSHYIYLENQARLKTETDLGFVNRVIKEMPRGTLVFSSKKTYYFNGPIIINRKDIKIDFNQSFLAFQGSIDYLIKVTDFDNLRLENIILTKIPETVGAFISARNGTAFELANLFGVNLGLDDLGVFTGVHKSYIKDVYVTNSNETLKGRGFAFNYCVNWDIENVMLSYFSIPFRWNATKDPEHGFMNEGFTLRGIKTLKSSVAFQIDMCTSLTASDIVLDFNQSFGIYNANGTNIRVNNFWIGMQDNVRATGIEIFKGLALSFKDGTIAGNWKAKELQQAFYSNVDTNATFEDIYLIDVNGGILSYPKINVKNISYFQNKQKPVDVVKKGNYQSSFMGIKSIDNPLAITNAAVDIISVDSRNSEYYIISEGYVNSKGVATIKTLKRGSGVDIDHTVYADGFNLTFTKGSFDPSYLQTIVRVSQVEKNVFMYDPDKDEWL